MAKIGVDYGHGKNTFPPSKGVYKNGVGYHEHDANVRVGLKLEEKLKKAGHTIVRGQEPNKNDVNLTTRTNKYFANNVDIIISCHANAGVSSASGYASFYWHNDKKAKKLSDLYEEEIKAQGFKLWGGSRPSRPNDWSNFHMCRIPAQRGIPSILLENGFMTNSGDFEWIFGSKKNQYAERCATAAFNAIQRYFGKSITVTPDKPQTGSSTVSTGTKGAGIEWIGTNDKGKELIVDTATLNYYNTQRWTNPTGSRKRGFKWKIDNLYRVNGSLQYRVQDANGNLFFTSARSDLVKIGGTYKANTSSTANTSSNTNKKASSNFNLKVDGSWGSATTRALQTVFETTVDGVISGQPNNSTTRNIPSASYGSGGSKLIRAMQKWLKTSQDGTVSSPSKMITALQKRLNMKVVDGKISSTSNVVKEIQRRLNAGTLK